MRQVRGGGTGEKKRLQYFEFGLQYLVQPLGVNPTYSTFKCCEKEWQHYKVVNALLSQLFLECVAGLNDRKGCIFTKVDQTKHEIFCVHIVCNEIQVKVNLEITTFFFYLRFPYCPNFF